MVIQSRKMRNCGKEMSMGNRKKEIPLAPFEKGVEEKEMLLKKGE